MTSEQTLLDEIHQLRAELQREKMELYNRRLSFGDLVSDRWENAKELGFGEGSSCYDNVLVIGDVRVGRNVWIGPNVILDGSAGLVIGDFCSISAGVQIYTHHTVAWANSMGEQPTETAPTTIGNGVYIGPNSVIQMGVTIGDRTTIGAMSLVNKDLPSAVRAWGAPARVQ